MSDSLAVRIQPENATSTINLSAENLPWAQATLAIVEVDNSGPSLRARNTSTSEPLTVSEGGYWSPNPAIYRFAVLFEGNPTNQAILDASPSGPGGFPPANWGDGIQIDIGGGYFGVLSGPRGNNLMALAGRSASSDVPDDVKYVWIVPSDDGDHLAVVIAREDEDAPTGTDGVVAVWARDRYVVKTAVWYEVGDLALMAMNVDELDTGSGFSTLEYCGAAVQTSDYVRGAPLIAVETDLDENEYRVTSPSGSEPEMEFEVTFNGSHLVTLAP